MGNAPGRTCIETLRDRKVAMTPIRIVKGLDIPIAGAPEQHIVTEAADVKSVALIGHDYAGLRPVIQVKEGERVQLGQPLFADRKCERAVFTSPGSGCVTAINRGARRALMSVIISLDGDDEITFPSWPQAELTGLHRGQVEDVLLSSGLWTAFRTRPHSFRADPNVSPAAIFVTAMDSNPLSAKGERIINAYRQDFADGLTVISHLTEGKVYVCQAPRASLPIGEGDNTQAVEFSGPHPSGLVGTHIHLLDPVSESKTVWHLNYQDVIAIGKLFTTGRLWVERIISFAGPGVRQPRLIRTRLGASTAELVDGELDDFACRIISGSVLSGRQAEGPSAFLGRFHNQISVFREKASVVETAHAGTSNRLFSAYSALVSGRPLKRKFNFTTGKNGALAPLVPLGGYERVMPLDVLPTPLIRALMVGDTDMAQALGCLELDEEDLALCAFVCPSKIDHGGLLRRTLEHLEKQG